MAVLDEAALHEVARVALKAWGLADADLELVSQSENAVFRVQSTDGGTLALRIHRPGYHDLDELNSELCWTAALNDAGVQIPAVKPTQDGQGYSTVPVPDADEVRHVGLMDWAEGKTLRSVIDDSTELDIQAQHFAALGRVAARIHNQASGWRPPVGFRRHSLDADGLMGNRPFWGPFWEHQALTPGQRQLVLAARRRLHGELSGYGKSKDRYGLIHADLHAENALIHDGRLTIIDFDDAGYGWHAYELAVAIYDHRNHPNGRAFVRALVQGYRELRPLSDEIVAALPLFCTIRSLALLGWMHQRPELEGNADSRSLVESTCRECEELLSRPA